MAKAVAKKAKKVARKVTEKISKAGHKMVKWKGRWTTCTPELVDRVCDSMRHGALAATALRSIGMPKDTFYGWLANAERDKVEGNEDSPFLAFAAKVDQAYAQAEVELLQGIHDSTLDRSQWQNKAWILERTRFADYGLKQDIRIEVDMPGPQLPPDPPKSHADWLKRKKERDELQEKAVDVAFEEIVND